MTQLFVPPWNSFTDLALIWASMAFSRVYLGDYCFTDVLAGFVLGLISLIGLIYFYLRPVGKS